jgi:hypothetical protein
MSLSVVWESIKHEFEPEGGWQGGWRGEWHDIYISNTDEQDWEKVLTFLRMSNHNLTFFRDGEQAELPPTVNAIFEISENESCFLSTDIGDNCLNCHFYGFFAEEIDFDFEPRDVHDLSSFNRLLDFVKHLAKVVDKPVGISILSHREETFLKFIPQTNKLIYQVNNKEQEIEI